MSDNQEYLQALPMDPGGQNEPWLRTTDVGQHPQFVKDERKPPWSPTKSPRSWASSQALNELDLWACAGSLSWDALSPKENKLWAGVTQ